MLCPRRRNTRRQMGSLPIDLRTIRRARGLGPVTRVSPITTPNGRSLRPGSTSTARRLQTEKTALDFFNAKLERYPNHLGRYVLWAGAQTLYGVPEHPR